MSVLDRFKKAYSFGMIGVYTCFDLIYFFHSIPGIVDYEVRQKVGDKQLDIRMPVRSSPMKFSKSFWTNVLNAPFKSSVKEAL